MYSKWVGRVGIRIQYDRRDQTGSLSLGRDSSTSRQQAGTGTGWKVDSGKMKHHAVSDGAVAGGTPWR